MRNVAARVLLTPATKNDNDDGGELELRAFSGRLSSFAPGLSLSLYLCSSEVLFTATINFCSGCCCCWCFIYTSSSPFCLLPFSTFLPFTSFFLCRRGEQSKQQNSQGRGTQRERERERKRERTFFLVVVTATQKTHTE